MVDQSATSADVFDVVTFEPEFVLLFWGDRDFDAWQHLDFSVDLFSEEISDLDSVAIFFNNHVDWEMRVNGSHFVSETGGDSSGHVVDVRADSSESSFLFHGGPPFGDSESLWSGLFEFDFQVAEVSFENERMFLKIVFFKICLPIEIICLQTICTSWSTDGDNLTFDGHFDGIAEFRQINIVVAVDGFHGASPSFLCF